MPFESLSETLLKAGVAPRHVNQYVGELQDHLDELKAQLQRSGCSCEEADSLARARLGDENALASAMLELPGIRTWSARTPWLIFCVVPTLIALAVYFTPFVIVELSSQFGGQPRSHYLVDAGNLVFAPALSAVFALLVARQQLHFRWALLAAVSIAALDLRLCAQFPSGAPTGQLLAGAALWIGSGNELARTWLPSAAQLVLTLLPATMALRGNRGWA